jgi:hypothetical protein
LCTGFRVVGEGEDAKVARVWLEVPCFRVMREKRAQEGRDMNVFGEKIPELQ